MRLINGMKTSQTIKIWKKFLKEHREIDEEVLEEEEPFQKDVKKGYLKDRDDYLTSGPQKSGGAPFEKKPKKSRSKSAPPAGVPVAEDASLDEGIMDRIKNIFGGRTAAGKSAETALGELDMDLNVKDVSIPLQNGKYPGSGEEALKDTQVLKLAALYKKEIPTVDMTSVEKMIKLDPTFGIKTMLGQTGVRNTADDAEEPGENTTEPQEDPSKPNEVSIQNDVIPKLRTISKQDKGKTKALKKLVGYKISDLPKKEVGRDHVVDILRLNKFSEEEVEELISVMGFKKIVKENLSINNVSGDDLAELIQNINKFYPYAQEYLKFDRPASLNLVSDPSNAKDAFGKTAYYNPNNDEITIFVDKRHPKDMIRSFSHELVHHAQNCRGEFDKEFVAGENYIEEDDHLNLMEREAYEKGNMCLRYYESYLKKENNKMSLNEENLRKAIREALKRVVENKTTTTEEVITEEVTTEENVEEAHCSSTRDDEKMEEEATTTEDTETINEEEVEEEIVNEEEVEEGYSSDKEKMEEEEISTTIRESLNKEKGKLIFNRLVDKWCK